MSIKFLPWKFYLDLKEAGGVSLADKTSLFSLFVASWIQLAEKALSCTECYLFKLGLSYSNNVILFFWEVALGKPKMGSLFHTDEMRAHWLGGVWVPCSFSDYKHPKWDCKYFHSCRQKSPKASVLPSAVWYPLMWIAFKKCIHFIFLTGWVCLFVCFFLAPFISVANTLV